MPPPPLFGTKKGQTNCLESRSSTANETEDMESRHNITEVVDLDQ